MLLVVLLIIAIVAHVLPTLSAACGPFLAGILATLAGLAVPILLGLFDDCRRQRASRRRRAC